MKDPRPIPEIVKNALAEEAEHYKGKFIYIGKKDGIDWYGYKYAEPIPFRFLYICGLKDGNLIRVSRSETLQIIRSLDEENEF